MSNTMIALLVFAMAGLLIVPMGLLISQLEKRAARKRGEPWPAA